jgi:hypothetical protein
MKVFIDEVVLFDGGKSVDLFVESDGTQFLLVAYDLEEYVDKKTQKVVQKKILGYFPTLLSVFQHVLKLKIMASNARTVDGLIYQLKEINEELKHILIGVSR